MKKANLKSLTRAMMSLWGNCSAVAFVEFAYTFPVMVMLFVGGTELANLAIINTRMSQISSQIADNVARVRNRIDEADINEILLGAKLASGSTDLLKNGRVIITSFEDDDGKASTTKQKIVWQRCKGIKTFSSAIGSDTDTGIGTATRKISVGPGDSAVYVELIYQYSPIFTSSIFGTQTVQYSSSFPVRDRVDNSMQNGNSLTGTKIAACSYYNDT